ncbi:MAG: hypothetical protein R2822_18975 [Spirosomataceae bacterium]
MSAFYQRRAYQYAWFSDNKLTTAALNFNQQRENYISDFADSSLYNAQIDTLLSNAQVNTAQFLANKQNRQTLELLLTTTFFKYTDKAFTGVVKDPIDLNWFIPRKKKSYQAIRYFGVWPGGAYPRTRQSVLWFVERKAKTIPRHRKKGRVGMH